METNNLNKKKKLSDFFGILSEGEGMMRDLEMCRNMDRRLDKQRLKRLLENE